MKISERKVLAREASRELLRTGVAFQDLSLKAVAAELGWSLGTLHRAYSITGTLLNDLLLEAEDATYSAVFMVGSQGLQAELVKQAHAMYELLNDLYHVQMMRYQMALGCRSENPLELRLRNTRDSSWEFTREVLIGIATRAGEEYSNLTVLTSIVTAQRDGLAYQFFSHGDRDMWLRDSLNAVELAVAFAAPRKLPSTGTAPEWSAERAAPLRPDLVHRPPDQHVAAAR